jgi:hypothetical protein
VHRVIVAQTDGVSVAAIAPAPDALVGTWVIRRRMVDRPAAISAAMDGRLTLAPDGDDIVWAETGVLHWSGQDLDVSRRYLIRATGDGWWMLFPDGRPFHPWTPGRPVVHPCGADVYTGVIRVDGPDRWRMLWDVTGPRKCQRIFTQFHRVDATLGTDGS